MANTSICMKSILAILGAAAMGLIPVTVADAANPEPVTVDMEFQDPITITENNPLQFGLLDVNMADTERVRVRPNGTTQDNDNNIIGGTQAAADVTVGAQASQTINIVVENKVGGTGYDLVRFRCRYNGATSDAIATPDIPKPRSRARPCSSAVTYEATVRPWRVWITAPSTSPLSISE